MRLALALSLALAGCTPPAPVAVVLPAPVIEEMPASPPPVRHRLAAHRPAVAVAAAAEEPAAADSPAAVLHDSAALTNKAFAYVEKPGAGDVKRLTVLQQHSDEATRVVRRQPHATAEQVATARAAAEALAAFFRDGHPAP